jgi:hypothetical protein
VAGSVSKNGGTLQCAEAIAKHATTLQAWAPL